MKDAAFTVRGAELETWGHTSLEKTNDLRLQIYEVMFSWEICPQSTFRMMVLKSTVSPMYNILMAESLRFYGFLTEIIGRS